jgi:DNA-binding transcriptional LysR family regulator
MQLGSLRIFCDVARHRSFSQAAQANHVTQSAVSQIVSQLEKELQVRLIDRSTRPLQLTPLGQAYYEGCKSLLDQYAELEASLRDRQADVAGTVQVAAIYSVGLSDMGQFVQRFTAEMPRTHVQIEYLHPDKVYEHVLDGTADLGLVSFPRKTPKLVAEPWREEEMVLVCAAKHPFAHRLAVGARDLDGQTFVHFERDLTIRRRVDQFLRKQGVQVDVKVEFDNIENIKQAVAIGAGVALLPEPTVRREVKARALAALPLHGSRLVRPLGIIHRRRPALGAAARRFVELLRAHDEPNPRRNGDVGPYAGGNLHSPKERNGKTRG